MVTSSKRQFIVTIMEYTYTHSARYYRHAIMGYRKVCIGRRRKNREKEAARRKAQTTRASKQKEKSMCFNIAVYIYYTAIAILYIYRIVYACMHI